MVEVGGEEIRLGYINKKAAEKLTVHSHTSARL